MKKMIGLFLKTIILTVPTYKIRVGINQININKNDRQPLLIIKYDIICIAERQT